MRKKLLLPIHPGEIPREEFMKPLGLSANVLAQRIGVIIARVNEIATERRGITADTALRLGRCFSSAAGVAQPLPFSAPCLAQPLALPSPSLWNNPPCEAPYAFCPASLPSLSPAMPCHVQRGTFP